LCVLTVTATVKCDLHGMAFQRYGERRPSAQTINSAVRTQFRSCFTVGDQTIELVGNCTGRALRLFIASSGTETDTLCNPTYRWIEYLLDMKITSTRITLLRDYDGAEGTTTMGVVELRNEEKARSVMAILRD